METMGGSSGSTITAAMPSPSAAADNCKVFCSSLFKATNYEFDPSISEEERRFYLKAYPTVDVVRERKTHCTVCKIHIGTAPVQENGIKMHPILRVTHCNKCHDFYNSGEFSKGEDGSELYCRWCGQGGEVYCCSSCPYVFCKSCIVKNLSRGVVADIEQNENWNCFSCAPKILWPLRAQHWALMNYIEQQKKELYALNLSESELKVNLGKDRSRCCRLAKAKCGNMSDSMESLDSVASKRSHSSSFSAKKPVKHSATPSPQHMNAAKRAKNNDEVVCTPDLLSMLEPDCQITVPPKPSRPMGTPSATTPKIMSIQQPQSGYNSMTSTPKSSAPPPLVLRNTAIKLRPAAPPPVVRRTIIGPRTPNPAGNGTPVYHTINGYRIDLNSAAQQETFRLPNGKLIQVKRQGPPPPQNASPTINNWQQMTSPQPQRVIPQTIASRAVQITPHPYSISVQQQQVPHPQVIRYHNNMIGTTTINPVTHNGTTIQVVNGQMTSTPQPPLQQQQTVAQSAIVRPIMVRHVFPDNPVGQARSGLQDQVFNAMEICTHLTNKVQTLTNSNAYKQARNFMEVKELYIHLSYLLTYAIGRFKSLQDKCLGDMRTLGFGNDADCLENGQLAADKQASDDEDNEIEIVEPKTDLITLDSDDEEPVSNISPNKSAQPFAQTKSQTAAFSSPQNNSEVKIKQGMSPVPIAPTNRPALITPLVPQTIATASQPDDSMDLMSMAQSFLASMLEVDIHEGPFNSPGSDSSSQKKQPRKKLTNKPNPTLLKQKALMERERLEEIKRNDQKLKMKCSVELKKAEEEFPYAKGMLEARAKEKLEMENNKDIEEDQKKLTTTTEADENDKSIEEVVINRSTEDKNETEDHDANKSTTKQKETTETSVNINDDSAEISQVDVAEKETALETSEKDTSVEVTVEIVEKSTEEIVLPEEDQSQDNKDIEAREADETSPTKEHQDTEESAISKTVDENIKDHGIKEDNKTMNGLTNDDEVTEKMEIDEGPPDTAKDESMVIDDKETPQANIGTKHELEATKITESKELETDTVAIADQSRENILQRQESDGEKITDKEITENKEQQPEDDADKNVTKSVEKTNEHELISSNGDVEHPTTTDIEISEKEATEDLPVSEEEINTNKVLPSVIEALPSKEQSIETSPTDFKEPTSPSNGNV